MQTESEQEYLLGANAKELERLRFQHEVWKPVTENLFQRLNVGAGWRCLDVGAGPGFVAMDLRRRVGGEGSVTALEPSSLFRGWLNKKIEEQQWTNVHCVQGMAETADLPKGHYNLIFVRWVISFVPDPDAFLTNLISLLAPGGMIALQDYYYEALSLYPHGAFNRVANIMRSYYRTNGGNAYVAGEVPAIFRKRGIRLLEFTPHCLAGGPDSGPTEWAGQFFTSHLPIMAEKGIISSEERDAILNDWNEHRRNPDMVFFSPLVVDIAGVKPK